MNTHFIIEYRLDWEILHIDQHRVSSYDNDT